MERLKIRKWAKKLYIFFAHCENLLALVITAVEISFSLPTSDQNVLVSDFVLCTTQGSQYCTQWHWVISLGRQRFYFGNEHGVENIYSHVRQ